MQETAKVLVLISLTKEQKSQLECAGFIFEYRTIEKMTDEDIENADIIFGNPPPAQIRFAQKLKLLQLETAGDDRYINPGILPAGAKLANASGAYGLAISEHMLAMLLCMLKKIGPYIDNMRDSKWTDLGEVRSVWGSRTLVVGLGDIGGEFAKRMSALGSHVAAIRRHEGPKPDYVDLTAGMDCLDRELARADFVACSLPETEETRGLFDAERISHIKPGAILINVGRGSLINTEALCAALADGHLGGACLDVVDGEPCPPDSPLWKAPNLILTPHVSGGHHLPETVNRIVGIAARNIRSIRDGRPILNEVDSASGYRKTQNRA